MTISPLLMLPGLLCDAALFKAQIEALADVATCTVADLSKDDDVAGMAARALAAAPAKFNLVALSMGGYVAFEILRQAPERVERLCLLDTSAKPDTEDKKARRRALMELAERGKFKGVTPKLLPSLVAPAHAAGAIADEILAMAERVGKEAFLLQQTAIMNRPDLRPTLTHVAIPTLIGVGDQDAITPPEEAREMHDLIKGSRLRVFGDSGHLSTLERPNGVSAAMREWLST